MPRGILDRGKDEIAGKTQASVRPKLGADARAGLYATWNGVGETDRLQDRQHRLVDALYVVFAERPVSATLQAGANGSDIIGKRRGPKCPARLTAA
jgi:hypothetical protein